MPIARMLGLVTGVGDSLSGLCPVCGDKHGLTVEADADRCGCSRCGRSFTDATLAEMLPAGYRFGLRGKR